MKRLFLLGFLFLAYCSQSFAQNSGVSFELHYPYPIANEQNYSSDLNGLLGGAVGFQFSDEEVLNYGVKYRFDQIIFNTNSSGSNKVNRNNLMIHHANGFLMYNMNAMETFKLAFEGGMTFYKYNASNTQPSYIGFNFSPGLVFEIQQKIYVFLNYSYIRANLKQKQTGFIDREKLQTVRLGIGFKL